MLHCLIVNLHMIFFKVFVSCLIKRSNNWFLNVKYVITIPYDDLFLKLNMHLEYL